MKAFLYLTALVLAVGSEASAQTLEVNAGPNICRVDANPDTFRLGRYPVVTTPNTGALTYSWRLANGASANGFLDSTTIEHPKLLPFTGSPAVDSVDFEVRVIGANGGSGVDTVRVYYARLTCLTASCGGTINAGDTLQLFNPCGTTGLQPFRYQWTPAEHLSDSTAATPKTWAPASRIYTSLVTDRLGCRWHGECPVTVNIVTPPPPPPPSQGINDPAAAGSLVVAPSPITAASVVRLPAGWAGASYAVFAADGRLVHSGTTTGETVSLAAYTAYPPGIYTFRIRSASGKTDRVRFEVR